MYPDRDTNTLKGISMDTDKDAFVISGKIFGYGYKYFKSIHKYLNVYFCSVILLISSDIAFIWISKCSFFIDSA